MANRPQDDVEEYLTGLAVERRLSEHTIKAYRRDIKKLFEFAEQRGLMLWQGLNNHSVRLFSVSLNSHGLHAKSIQRILSAGRGLSQFLIQKRLLTTNPFDDVRAPKAEKRLPKTLSVDQVTSLIEIDINDPLSYRDKAVMELFYSSGLRLAELCSLDLHDLSLPDNMVRVTGKGNNCLLYTSPSPRDLSTSRMPSSA